MLTFFRALASVYAIFLLLHSSIANAAEPSSGLRSGKAGAQVVERKEGGIGAEDYVIQSLDLIRVQIYQEPELSRELRVSQEGKIELPLVRSVEVRGKTVAEAELIIRKLYDADYLVNPQVNVSVLEYAPRSVEIFGAVGSPGVVYFPKEEGLTLTGAISRAGSFTRLANKKSVTLKRTLPDGSIKTFTINVEELTKGDSKETWPLQPGDVVTVPERII